MAEYSQKSEYSQAPKNHKVSPLASQPHTDPFSILDTSSKSGKAFPVNWGINKIWMNSSAWEGQPNRRHFSKKWRFQEWGTESKPLLPEQCVLLWLQGHLRKVELLKLAPHLTVNQPSVSLLKFHFPVSSGTPLQACPQPFTAEAFRSSTVCKCNHRWFFWQGAAG